MPEDEIEFVKKVPSRPRDTLKRLTKKKKDDAVYEKGPFPS